MPEIQIEKCPPSPLPSNYTQKIFKCTSRFLSISTLKKKTDINHMLGKLVKLLNIQRIRFESIDLSDKKTPSE